MDVGLYFEATKDNMVSHLIACCNDSPKLQNFMCYKEAEQEVLVNCETKYLDTLKCIKDNDGAEKCGAKMAGMLACWAKSTGYGMPKK